MDRAELEDVYGKDNVFDTTELQEKFEVHSFLAPFISCTRKSDGVSGSMEFQATPRYYFKFMAKD